MWFTGSIQNHDALCILPLNILNEKIYIFLWFWFIILSLLSGLALLYSIGIVVYPPVRETVLKRRFKFRIPGGVATVVAKTQVSSIHMLLLKFVHVYIMDAFRC
jgi:Innexin.